MGFRFNDSFGITLFYAGRLIHLNISTSIISSVQCAYTLTLLEAMIQTQREPIEEVQMQYSIIFVCV